MLLQEKIYAEVDQECIIDGSLANLWTTPPSRLATPEEGTINDVVA